MDTVDLQHLLNTHPWQARFAEGALRRAEAYVRRGHVIAVHHQPGAVTDTMYGVVRGTAREPYRCVIRTTMQDGRLLVASECSCPMLRDCKHVAAVLLLAAAEPSASWPGLAGSAATGATPAPSTPPTNAPRAATRRGSEANRTWAHWLRALDVAPPQPRAPEAGDGRQFGVLLRGAEVGSPPGLLASLVWLRPSRRRARGTGAGNLVDPQPLVLDPRHGPAPTPDGGWPAELVSALALLLQEPPIRLAGQRWTLIHAAYQEQALELLLTRFPAYYERASTPVTRGAKLALQPRWRAEADGSQRLVAAVGTAAPVQLLHGARLWYMLPGEQRYGMVDSDPGWLEALAHMPPVQPEEVPALRTHWSQSPVTAALPPPEERGPLEIIDTAPAPVLQLRVVKARVARARAPTALGCARLAFDYGPVRIARDASGATVRRLQDGRLFEVRRQYPAELAAQEPLRRAGLTGIGWYASDHGIPDRQVAEDDLLLQPNPRQRALAASEWQPAIEQLLAEGFRIEYSADFPRQQLVAIDDWHADVQAHGNQWFDVSLGIDVGGQRVDLLPLLRRMLQDPAFPLKAPPREKKDATWRIVLDATRSVDMPLARLRALIEPLLEWIQGDSDELRLHRTRAAALTAMASAAQLHWRGGDLLRSQLELLQHVARSAAAPPGFQGTLRPYQSEGLAWLNFLGDAGLGGILADDMGLGKTVQVLAHIVREREEGRLKQPALVVVPTSLVGNWRDEAARFAPMLKVLVLHGAQRGDLYAAIPDHDLVITTYPLLPRDEELLRAARFSLLVLDEAQAIKNPHSQAAQAARNLPAKRRLAMTGTPLENHLGELWAQFDAVEPGLLGSERQFTRLYRTPIEKHGDGDRQQRLNQRIGALLLRRRKQDVLTDLPPKTEITLPLELEDAQRGLYETLRLAQHERVQQVVRERGLAQAGIVVLDALLKLRQVCCDPRLVKLPSARKVRQSAKLDALLELLASLLGEGRRVLLFSQFTEMLTLIEGALQGQQIPFQTLTGQTPARERTALVKRFQRSEVPLFLISLKAGGVGLNLTAADTVIHYDPWWNPAVETQATDRAHRIGQDKSVFFYRLICTGTVEEKIHALQARKADLAQAVLDGGGTTQRLRFDAADLEELFAPL